MGAARAFALCPGGTRRIFALPGPPSGGEVRPAHRGTVMPVDVLKGARPQPSVAVGQLASRRSTAVMAVLLLGAMSCSDATTSPPSLTVAVSVTHVAAPVLGATSDSLPTIACDANLTATATGSGTASWRDAKVLWYAGTSRSCPLYSTVASAADVQTAWGSAQIAAGHAQTSVWAVTAGAPFHVMFEYNYQVTGGDAKTATAEFDCGPKIYGTTAPPSIDTVLVQTGSGPVQPGDSITVHYTVTSPIGVLAVRRDAVGAMHRHAVVSRVAAAQGGALGIAQARVRMCPRRPHHHHGGGERRGASNEHPRGGHAGRAGGRDAALSLRNVRHDGSCTLRGIDSRRILFRRRLHCRVRLRGGQPRDGRRRLAGAPLRRRARRLSRRGWRTGERPGVHSPEPGGRPGRSSSGCSRAIWPETSAIPSRRRPTG